MKTTLIFLLFIFPTFGAEQTADTPKNTPIPFTGPEFKSLSPTGVADAVLASLNGNDGMLNPELANQIKDLTPNQILEMFNLPPDLTKEDGKKAGGALEFDLNKVKELSRRDPKAWNQLAALMDHHPNGESAFFKISKAIESVRGRGNGCLYCSLARYGRSEWGTSQAITNHATSRGLNPTQALASSKSGECISCKGGAAGACTSCKGGGGAGGCTSCKGGGGNNLSGDPKSNDGGGSTGGGSIAGSPGSVGGLGGSSSGPSSSASHQGSANSPTIASSSSAANSNTNAPAPAGWNSRTDPMAVALGKTEEELTTSKLVSQLGTAPKEKKAKSKKPEKKTQSPLVTPLVGQTQYLLDMSASQRLLNAAKPKASVHTTPLLQAPSVPLVAFESSVKKEETARAMMNRQTSPQPSGPARNSPLAGGIYQSSGELVATHPRTGSNLIED